jgi:hypothetical protein
MLKTVTAALSLAFGAAAVHADVLLLDGVEMDAQTQSTRPGRGMSMDRVAATFGEPASRHAAVGEPPITRWDYPGFSVYFEHQHVIHSVVQRAPARSQ